MSFLRNSKAPAGMTTRGSGLLPQIILPDVIFEKFKGHCGHDDPSFGAFAPNHFCQDSWQSQMLSTGWPAGRPILILFPPLLIRIWVEIKDQEAFGPPPEAEF